MKNIVYLPGTLCDERMWHYQLAEFPGRVVNLRVQNTLEAMLDAVYEIPFDSFVLVGFSLGGYVAQEFALRNSERVEHLVLMGSATEGYPPKERELIIKSRPMIEKGMFRGVTDRRLQDLLYPDSFAKKDLRQLIHDMAGHDAAAVYLRQLDATLDRRVLTDAIRNLSCPLTALAGAQDPMIVPESIKAFEQLVPGAKVHMIDKCGHFIPLEQPEQTNQILQTIVQE